MIGACVMSAETTLDWSQTIFVYITHGSKGNHQSTTSLKCSGDSLSSPSWAPWGHQPRSADCMLCLDHEDRQSRSHTRSAVLLLSFGGRLRGFFLGSGSVMILVLAFTVCFRIVVLPSGCSWSWGEKLITILSFYKQLASTTSSDFKRTTFGTI